MSAMVMPDGSTMEIFGSGGGQTVADRLTQITGTTIPLLGSIPLDPNLRTGGDSGEPVSISQPDSPAGKALNSIADKLVKRKESLLGKTLGLGISKK